MIVLLLRPASSKREADAIEQRAEQADHAVAHLEVAETAYPPAPVYCITLRPGRNYTWLASARKISIDDPVAPFRGYRSRR